MPLYTVDASVFLNGFNPAEAGHADSRAFLDHLKKSGAPVIVPVLIFPELSGAISRGQNDFQKGIRFAGAVSRLPGIVKVDLDERLAQAAAGLAARYRLRGSDAVYAATAERFGSILVTLDQEQYRRVKPALLTQTPVEVLTTISGGYQVA